MHRLVVDTSVWLDLAKHPDREIIIKKLGEFGATRQLALHVPRIVKDEFERNAPDYAKREAQRIRQHLKETRKAAKALLTTDRQTSTLEALDQLLAEVAKAEASTELGVAVLRSVMVASYSQIVEHDDKQQLRAFERGLKKLAPLQSKNSCADALVLESFVAIADLFPNDVCLLVTSNLSDFSDDKDYRRPHADFATIFAPKSRLFFINIGDALNEVSTNALPAEIVQQFAPVTPGLCPICGKPTGTMMLTSAYGGWTLHYVCHACHWVMDSEELLGRRMYAEG